MANNKSSLGLMGEVNRARSNRPKAQREENTAPVVKSEVPAEKTTVVRQTFVVDPAQLRKLKLMAADTTRQQKDLIREALDLLFEKWEATKDNAISL